MDHETQRESIQKSYERLNEQYQRVKNELAMNQAEYEYQKKRISDQEVERLKSVLEQREREVEELRMRNSQLEVTCIDVKKLESMKNELENQLEMAHKGNALLKGQLDKKDYAIDELQDQLRKTQDQLRQQHSAESRVRTQREEELLKEIQYYRAIIVEREHVIEQQVLQIQQLQEQLGLQEDRIRQIREEYERELDEMQEKNNRNERDFRDNLDKKFNLLKKEIEQLQAERNTLLGEYQGIQQQKVDHNYNSNTSLLPRSTPRSKSSS